MSDEQDIRARHPAAEWPDGRPTHNRKLSDTELLDGLQAQLGSGGGHVVCRWSIRGRGWRLHEARPEEWVQTGSNVREAIAKFLAEVERSLHTICVCDHCTNLRQPGYLRCLACEYARYEEPTP